jgi:trehalose utilization protein
MTTRHRVGPYGLSNPLRPSLQDFCTSIQALRRSKLWDRIPQTEMYDEPFHVPEPDEVILEERWATGEWFRSGALWKLGRGQVFYFRPGHETFPVFKQDLPLKIVTNAVRWLAQ